MMNSYFLKKAEENNPKLIETIVKPERFVRVVEDKNIAYGIGVEDAGSPPDVLFTGDSIIVDFGRHCVGTLSFKMSRVDRYLDAPVRIKVRFAEIPMELASDFTKYKGRLCASWLQEEIFTLDYAGICTFPRRYSFRYCEITILNAHRKLHLSDFEVKAVTSADYNNLEPLKNITDPELIEIDKVGARTLAECMQNSYEDGPKRDRRLWTGDLYLQSLTDFTLFKNHALTRRCLYLFASCFEEEKYLPGCLYYYPEYYYDQGLGIADYAFLFVVTLCEYYANSQDDVTARELFPIAQKQLDMTIRNLDKNGIITLLDGWNSFIDWAPDKKVITSVHGVFLYTLAKCIELARALGENEAADKWEKALEDGKRSAMNALYDSEKKAFINTYDENQYSVHSQVWMILGGVVEGEEAIKMLHDVLSAPDSLKPVTPFMHHYVVDAMFKLGLRDEAIAYIKGYWGGMVKLGADTFWEVYIPNDLEASPYGDKLANTFCHAWSCTPSYFIRKYLDK